MSKYSYNQSDDNKSDDEIRDELTGQLRLF